jgi:sulfur transfer protein SufE
MNAILKRVAARREYLQKLDELGLDVANLIDENEAQAKFCQECKSKFFADMQ